MLAWAVLEKIMFDIIHSKNHSLPAVQIPPAAQKSLKKASRGLCQIPDRDYGGLLEALCTKLIGARVRKSAYRAGFPQG